MRCQGGRHMLATEFAPPLSLPVVLHMEAHVVSEHETGVALLLVLSMIGSRT